MGAQQLMWVRELWPFWPPTRVPRRHCHTALCDSQEKAEDCRGPLPENSFNTPLSLAGRLFETFL